jgi:hypothetical protein
MNCPSTGSGCSSRGAGGGFTRCTAVKPRTHTVTRSSSSSTISDVSVSSSVPQPAVAARAVVIADTGSETTVDDRSRDVGAGLATEAAPGRAGTAAVH